MPSLCPEGHPRIHICLCGAMSHIDTFDYKPGLIAAHGKPVNSSTKPDTFFGQVGRLRRPDWAFRQRGESGLWVSDLFPNLAQVADELTVIRSMVAETSNHTPATFQENSGFRLNGFPCAGAWLSYGLGSESDDLPAFVVIPDAREFPAGGAINWTNGFLPARHQGVVIRPQGEPIDDLFPACARSARNPRPALATGGGDEPQPHRPAPRRRCSGGAHSGLRDGRADADLGSAGRRLEGRESGDARALRQSTARNLPTSAARACSRGGCSSAACGSCRSTPAARSAARAGTGTVMKT